MAILTGHIGLPHVTAGDLWRGPRYARDGADQSIAGKSFPSGTHHGASHDVSSRKTLQEETAICRGQILIMKQGCPT